MATEIEKAYVQILPSFKGFKSELDKGLTEGISEASSAASGANTNFSAWQVTLGSLAAVGIAGVVSGLGQLATKIADVATELAKSAVSNYADYEQLVGGVETLFDDSSDKVIEYAENAYKTAGLSSNEYMETVTSFSASLLQSLGGDTDKAAEEANRAITDMSDNANKMGTDMESIQNAYQGFAKQNYTMLDNLKLGYGGTKEEMQRLLEDATAISGIEYDISSYADIVEAIHQVQKEMGISGITAEEAAAAVEAGTMTEEEAFEALGTTAKEASTTISGNWSSIQAMFQNILTKVGGELAPVVMNFLTQVSDFLDGVDWDAFAESVGDALGGVIDKLSTVDLGTIFDKAFTFIQSLISVGGGVLNVVVTVLMNLFTWLGNVGNVIGTVVAPFVDYFKEALGRLKEALQPVIDKLAEWFGGAGNGTIWGAIIGSVISTIITYISVAIDIIAAIVNAIKIAATGIATVVQGIATVVSTVFNVIKTTVTTIWNGIKTTITTVIGAIKTSVTTVFGTIKSTIIKAFESVKTKVESIWDAIWGTIKGVINKILSGIESFINGIIRGINKLLSGINSVASLFGVSAGFQISTVSLPRLEQGGVLEKGQVGLLEGTGAEAVVPLENNRKWISAVASEMESVQGGGETIDLLSQLVAIVSELKNMGIYMYPDKLVGVLAEPMDAKLGKLRASAARS